ncbi:histone-lysine N-methyltransferase NSD2 isoform X2 [Pseudomyrmex gracilis]|uniref:histone-lysine N-methyltransferase NSD2 isoform X2 n=1 Tax=Pseudomyrmex gracilis TaxID=219809 RepID=UPI000994FDEC|nr:histone-lysine N-methyltransferase NSD2 isoform X2 [Pseudomyrmex gracilis]
MNDSQPAENVKMRKVRENSIENTESTDENNVGSSIKDEPVSSPVSTSMEEEISSEQAIVPNVCVVECPWVLGQLAWARVGNFPFWPCVVTLDPETMTYHKFRVSSRSSVLLVHVQYFGDKERHNWVTKNCMMEFTSIEDFMNLSKMLTPEMKKKDPKYAAALVVRKAKKKWNEAVKEALEVQQLTLEERNERFAPKKKKKTERAKRKFSTDLDKPNVKRTKHNNVHNAEKSSVSSPSPHQFEVAKPKTKSRIKNGKLTPKFSDTSSTPSSPSSHRDFVDDLKAIKSEEDIFEIYYQRNKELMIIEYPDTPEEEIKEYLRRTWNGMDKTFQHKYEVHLTETGSTHSKESSPIRDDEISIEIIHVSTKDAKRLRNKIEREENSVAVETKRYRPYNIFKGLKQERVCQICEKTGKLTRCKGPCYSYFHLSCVKPSESSPEHSDESTSDDKILEDLNIIRQSITNSGNKNNDKPEEQEDENFKCIDCLSGVAPACFICNEREGDRIRCIVPACGKHYHPACLKSWPQSHWQGGRLTCSYHVCHTCSSDNPQDNHSRAPNEKMARCVRCPSSYHASTLCLPAGSVLLTASQIVCPKHYKAPPLNASWCFLCPRGGSLICCDTCPNSFHLECLGIDAPDGGFICEDCETGRLPLYGEIVWAKLGHYRWWPSRICYPQEIPEKVESLPHSPGKFCVMFLGSNDYYWVHRGRVFLYQDGDANIKAPIGKKTVTEEAYQIALQEANRLHQQLKAQRSRTKESKALKPPPYVKLKVNKPVGNVKPTEVEGSVACECNPEWSTPCAPGTDCLNRILLVECNPAICPAGSKCMNQSFVLRQYPEMEPFHTKGRGWGLRSLEFIQSGQFVIEYVGEIIDEAEYKRRLQRKKELKNENFYFLTIDNNRTIDAEPKGNLSRFMNHSCAPNCETQKWTVNGDTRIGLFALRDIQLGEELTFNYNLASDGETRKKCLCGASNCSGFIGLKAQKQQLPTLQTTSTMLPKSALQIKKIDKRSKRFKKYTCWRCGEIISDYNILTICSQRTCGKKYHAACVEIDDVENKFCCPWHFCLECDRRTTVHCSFCSKAFCQLHFEGNLLERDSEKGGFVCKLHENLDVHKSVEDEKEYSDNETDKEYSSTSPSSSSPIVMEKVTGRESSPRVSIVEQ